MHNGPALRSRRLKLAPADFDASLQASAAPLSHATILLIHNAVAIFTPFAISPLLDDFDLR
jgi:hypothetical protein